MKIIWFVLILLLHVKIVSSQNEILNVILKFELKSELNLLSDSKSYVKTTEEYLLDSLIKKNTSQSFYNYDTIKYCFNHEHKFYDMVFDFCELKKISKNKFIQTTTYLYDDEFTKEELHVFINNERIDSTIEYENGILNRKIIGVYEDNQLTEKQYYSNSFGNSKSKIEYTENKATIKFTKENEEVSKTIYTVSDSIVSFQNYQPLNKLNQHKEFEIKMFDNNRPKEIRTFKISPTNERVLLETVYFTYEKNTYIKHVERFDEKFIMTITEDYNSEEKIIERKWPDRGKRIIEKYNYF